MIMIAQEAQHESRADYLSFKANSFCWWFYSCLKAKQDSFKS